MNTGMRYTFSNNNNIFGQFFVTHVSSSGTCIRVQTSNPQNYNIDKIQVIVNGLLHQTQTFNFNEFTISNLQESTTYQIKLIAEIGDFKLHSNTIDESTGTIDSLSLKNKATNLFNFNETTGNVYDSIGNEEAVLNNITMGETGINGNALKINGSDSFVDFGVKNYLTQTGNHSVSIWIYKYDDLRAEFFRKNQDTGREGGQSTGWGFTMNTVNSQKYVTKCVTTDTVPALNAIDFNFNPSILEWHNIGLTFDSANKKFKSYYDGILIGEISTAGSVLRTASTPTYIGKREITTYESIFKVDQLFFSNNTVLTDCDFSDIYNNKQGINL